MRRIVIAKVGSTLPSLALHKGDFEDWIQAGLEIPAEGTVVAHVCNGSALPSHDAIAGIVVTGSHAMVTEHHDWSERTAEWLVGAVEKRIPTLGICYGHQLLAYALGGKVGVNPKGREFGTLEVHLEKRAQEDALFRGLPTPITVHLSHTQSVLLLPAQARRLAYSKREDCQAFAAGGCAWGVQFHPEFDAAIVREYIGSHQEELSADGQDPAALIAQTADTPYGTAILKRFASIVGGSSQR
jgi:GMP synthase (glutamine-hydrolysing)